jgi:hypothetical protein
MFDGTGPTEVRRKRAGRYALIGSLAAALTMIVVTLVPIPLPFSLTLVTRFQFGGSLMAKYDSANVSVSLGSQVDGSWNSVNGVNVTFLIRPLAQINNASYVSRGTSGSFSFTATFSGYSFAAISDSRDPPATVSIRGTCSAPILPL